MVDPRHDPDRPGNGTHPRQPNVGGPAPDRPPAGPGDPRRRHRVLTAIAIVVAIAVIILGGLLAAPYFGIIDGEAPPPAQTQGQPPNGATATAANQAAEPKPGDCRSFEKTVQIGGEARKVTGRACLQPDGSWQVVE